MSLLGARELDKEKNLKACFCCRFLWLTQSVKNVLFLFDLQAVLVSKISHNIEDTNSQLRILILHEQKENMKSRFTQVQ